MLSLSTTALLVVTRFAAVGFSLFLSLSHSLTSLCHLSIMFGRTDEELDLGALLSGDPPGFREVSQPDLLIGGELEDEVERGTLGPVGAVAVTSRVRLLASAAGISEHCLSRCDRGAAVSVVLAFYQDTVAKEGFLPDPRAALSVGRVEEDTLVLQMSAMFMLIARLKALFVLKVVVPGKADITVEHHLEMILVPSQVDSLPLGLCRVTADRETRTPALGQERLVEVVVEDTLVVGVTPVTLIARVLRLSGAESMSTSDSGDESPSQALVVDIFEDMVYEDPLEIIAAFLGVRHEARSRALVGSDATVSESVAQGE